MDRQAFQGWLDRYVDAWKTYEPQGIADLWSDNAEYRYHPLDEPVRGRDAIVANWLESKDDPGTYDAKYEVVAVDGDMHVAKGWSRYFENGQMSDEFWNVYLCRFDADGRCTEFTEYWIQNREMRRTALDEMIRKAGGTPPTRDEEPEAAA
ncbi:MAG: nuclear transport factor 2 family protein [Candidatus Limnocylindrales bacterium]